MLICKQHALRVGWFAVVWLAPLLASACNVPVFRYALERWAPDPYQAVVFHKEPLTTNQQALIDAWGKAGEQALVNLVVEKVDLSGEIPKEHQAAWNAQSNATLPWLVILYPQSRDSDSLLWAGPLDSAPKNTLVDSPARRELVRRLCKGDSAVWLFVESGNKAKDDLVENLLVSESKKLELELKLPEVAPDDPQIRSEVPLKIAFSTLRVSRNNPAEQILLNMLLRLDREITHSTEPMLFGVFGRGRALPPVIGKDITASVLAEISDFIVGACSCQVKSMNPGFDLLVAADWEGSLEGKVVKDPELPPLIGMVAMAPAPSTNPAYALTTTNALPNALAGNLKRNLVGVLAGALLLLGLGTFVLKRKSSLPK